MGLKKAVSSFGIVFLTALIIYAIASCDSPANDPPAQSAPEPIVINIADIQGITVPVTGGTPVKAIRENAQYTGTVTWEPQGDGTFAIYNNYKATITLKPKSGYTLEGVAEDFFKVEGAYWVSNSANSGVITAEFPQTTAIPVNIAVIQGISAPVAGAAIPETIETFENEQYSGSVHWLEKQYHGDDDYEFGWLTSMTFKAFTQYAAAIYLTPKESYTVQEVPDGFFTVEGAELIRQTYEHPYLIILAAFPETGALPPDYGIFLAATESYPIIYIDEHTFPTSVFNYTTELMPLYVYVFNSGDQATGDLSVALSGTDPGSFTLSETSLGEIEAGGRHKIFTVVPNTGLAPGTYAATVTVSGSNGITAGFDVDFTVIAPTYGISISANEIPVSASYIYTFPDADFGYGFIRPMYVYVTNTGNQPTGDLNISLTGDSDGFYFYYTPLNSIAAGGKKAELGIYVNYGLAPGTYVATVNVSGSNGITASFNVSFTVNPPTYGISLSTGSSYTFPDAAFNYGAQTPLTVTVTNTGNQPTGSLYTTLKGTNPGSFTRSATSMSGIAVGGTGSFTLVPNTGLAPGIYTATVTVFGNNDITASFNLSFTVNAPTYGVSLSSAGTHTFASVIEGYGAINSLNVTVTNTNNQPTGNLAAALGGENPGSFTLSTTSINSIAVGGNSAFTVRPNTGLAAGIHTATITVSGSNGITASFNVSFTVNPATYGVSLSRTDTYTFPALIEGYGAITPINVALTNTGNQPTGTLAVTLEGTNSGGFTLSTASINNIAVGGNSSFTVRPNTGLGAGTHTAAVTVSGSNGITASFNLSFNVIAATYGITLSAVDAYTFPAADLGYTAQNPLAVTITNTGNQPSGTLSVMLSGTDSGSFTLSTSSINSIATGGNGAFNVAPKTGLAPKTYAATVTVSGSNGITASFDVDFFVDDPAIPYIITGDDGSFTATRGGITIGTANQSMQTVINGIRTHAAGKNRVIQFGNGYGLTAGIDFTNTGGTWGAITITGKIFGGIYIGNSVSVTSSADIENPINEGIAVSNSGVFNITGGTVSARGIYNSTSYLHTYGAAVNNTGVLNISGGTVKATERNGYAIFNNNSGRITISGTAKVTSQNTDNDSTFGGTIYLYGTYTTGVQLEITGGTVENTASGGYTIHNRSPASIKISGGTVSSTGNGIAVFNFRGNSVVISGGRIDASGGGVAVRSYMKNSVTITKPPAVILGAVILD